MKHYIITLALLISALLPQTVLAQTDANKDANDSVTLYSDTTETELDEDTTIVYTSVNGTKLNMNLNELMDELKSGDAGETVIAIIAIICAVLIPCLCIFLLPILIIFFILRSRRRREKERIELIKTLAANNKDATPYLNMLKEDTKKYASANGEEYKKGIRNVCLGIGLAIFLYMVTNSSGVASVGVLIACIGAGQIWSAKKGESNIGNYSKEEEAEIISETPAEGTEEK